MEISRNHQLCIDASVVRVDRLLVNVCNDSKCVVEKMSIMRTETLVRSENGQRISYRDVVVARSVHTLREVNILQFIWCWCDSVLRTRLLMSEVN